MLRVYVGGFLLPMAAAVSITTYMLCLVASKRPSKTDPYNTANIMSHAITLVTLISSVGLKFPQVRASYSLSESLFSYNMKGLYEGLMYFPPGAAGGRLALAGGDRAHARHRPNPVLGLPHQGLARQPQEDGGHVQGRGPQGRRAEEGLLPGRIYEGALLFVTGISCNYGVRHTKEIGEGK